MDKFDEAELDNIYKSLLSIYKKSSSEEFERHVLSMKRKFNQFNTYRFQYTDEFIPYPSVNNDDFNKEIFLKKEFNRYKSTIDPKKKYKDIVSDKCDFTSGFNLSDNQKLVKNILSPLTPYNGLLLFHSVGVGKTASAITIAEEYYDIYKKRVLVSLPANLIENFRNQIFDIQKYNWDNDTSTLCTGTKYTDMVLNKDELRLFKNRNEEITKKINAFINERYEFLPFQKLANRIEDISKRINKEVYLDETIREQKINDEIRQRFSNRLFIIDEAHNILSKSENKNPKKTSDNILKLIHNAENMKLLMLTATPMFDKATQIVFLLNLLLINDRRPILEESDIFDKNNNLKDGGKKILIENTRGYISFMRGENPYSFPFRFYPSFNGENPDKKLIDNKKYGIEFLDIIGSQMSTIQKAAYDKYKGEFNEEEDDDVDDTEDKREDDKGNEKLMQISNIVFSDSLDNESSVSGKNGYDSIFKTESGKISYKNPKNQILKFDSLSMYSPKIKTILEYIMNSEGIVFVYSRYKAAGIYPLAIALEHIGFKNYNGNIGDNLDITQEVKAPYNKYALLTDRSKMQELISISKQRDNRDGSKIKVILGTSMVSEGIDFKNIREVHLLDPWWNLNKTEQIIGRAVRNCSHIDLPLEKRNVTIYLHANLYDTSGKVIPIDISRYKRGEKKQKQIFEVENILQENAIDCLLNKDVLSFPIKDVKRTFPRVVTSQKNVLEKYKVGDRDGSLTCKLKKCKTFCSNEPNKNENLVIEESTFDKYFVKDDIDTYKRRISELYKDSISYSFDDIKILLKVDDDDEVLSYALDEMLKDKYIVKRSKNEIGRLIYRSDLYIFQSDTFRDVRIALDDRKTSIEKREKIELNFLKTKIKEVEKTIEVKEKIQSTPEEKTTNIVDLIENLYKIYLHFYMIIIRFTNVNNLKMWRQSIAEHIIDSINKEQFIQLVSYIHENPLDSMHEEIKRRILNTENDQFKNFITKSLCAKESIPILRSDLEKEMNTTTLHVFHKMIKEALKPIFIDNVLLYLYYDGEFYIYANGSYKIASSGIKEKYEDKIDNFKLNDKKPTAIGYRELKLVKKTNISQNEFKVKKNKDDSGAVCTTGGIKLHEFTKLINNIDPNEHRIIIELPEHDIGLKELVKEKQAVHGATISKDSFCEIFEIALRARNLEKNTTEFFMRPILNKHKK